MFCYVFGCVVHDVSKEHGTVIFKGQAAKKDDPLILEEEGITSGRNVISCPMMQSHIPEDLNRVCTN